MDFEQDLQTEDREIYDLIRQELKRQQEQIELIASENIVSKAVMEAQGSVLTNKYAEGYPGRRYYHGCEFVDKVEQLTGPKSCLMHNLSMCSLIPEARPTRRFIWRFCNRMIPFSA